LPRISNESHHLQLSAMSILGRLGELERVLARVRRRTAHKEQKVQIRSVRTAGMHRRLLRERRVQPGGVRRLVQVGIVRSVLGHLRRRRAVKDEILPDQRLPGIGSQQQGLQHPGVPVLEQLEQFRPVQRLVRRRQQVEEQGVHRRGAGRRRLPGTHRVR